MKKVSVYLPWIWVNWTAWCGFWQMRELDVFQVAQCVKVNPDSPQKQVRFLTLSGLLLHLVFLFWVVLSGEGNVVYEHWFWVGLSGEGNVQVSFVCGAVWLTPHWFCCNFSGFEGTVDKWEITRNEKVLERYMLMISGRIMLLALAFCNHTKPHI